MEHISKDLAIKIKEFVPEQPLCPGQWFYDLDLPSAQPLMYVCPNFVYAGGTMSTYFPTPSKRARAYTAGDLLSFLHATCIRKSQLWNVSSLGITKDAETVADAMAEVVIEYYKQIKLK